MEGYNYRLQLVYVEPLPWFHFLQFRYSYQYRVNNSDRFVYNRNKELEEFAPDYDEDASNCFENLYSNHLFNLAVRHRLKVAYIRLTAFSPIYNLQTGTFGELITEIDGRRNIKNRLSQRFFCRSCLFQKRTADRLLRFKVSTDIIIIFLTRSTDRKQLF